MIVHFHQIRPSVSREKSGNRTTEKGIYTGKLIKCHITETACLITESEAISLILTLRSSFFMFNGVSIYMHSARHTLAPCTFKARLEAYLRRCV